MTPLLTARRGRLTLGTGLAIALAAAAAVLAAPSGAASTTDPTGHGQRLSSALAGLSSSQESALAGANGLTTQRLRAFAADPTSYVDASGRIYVVEPKAPRLTDAQRHPAAATPRLPLATTFTLHSRPGSQRTLYLDFTGHVVKNTAWNASTGVVSATIHPYDTDGAPGTFSAEEQAVVQSVWQRVAEDYSTRDVDVTTQQPAQAKITRSGASDQVYGTRVVISPDDFYYSSCGCGGIAYVGVFDLATNHDYYQPAFVFTQGVGNDAKNISEAAAHEAGHNVGLSHDGTSTVGYYEGQGSWAPIMGVGYYRPTSQWSKGEYADANNTEDDLAVMGTHGVAQVPDDHGNTPGTATTFGADPLLGIIGSRTDVDVFKVVHPGGTFSVRASGFGDSTDLDVILKVTKANGSVVATNNPASFFVSEDSAGGMGAEVTTTLAAGTYYVKVDGTGFGNARTTGYSDYASIGQYVIYHP